MYPKTIIAVLLVALLVFGCTSSSPSNGGTSPTQGGAQQGQPATGSGQPAPVVNSTQPSGGQPPVNPTPAANVSTSSGNSGSQSGANFVGKSYEQLMALGVPVQCNITTSSGTVKFYKDSGTDMRTEMSVSGAPCPVIVSIVIGNTYYVGCEQGTLMPGSSCQWLTFSTNETGAANPEAGAITSAYSPDYSSIPAAQISCIPWVPDPSMLQAPANACSLQDMMNTQP